MSREEKVVKVSRESLFRKPRIKPHHSKLRVSGRLHRTKQAGLAEDYKRVQLDPLTECRTVELGVYRPEPCDSRPEGQFFWDSRRETNTAACTEVYPPYMHHSHPA